MLNLALRTDGESLRALALGAHPDDIEIGCGGSILDLASRYPALHITWVVLSADGDRVGEARSSAAAFLESAPSSEVEVCSFRDAFFPHQPEVKEFFEELKQRVSPDLVFTHRREDLHQDHRTIAELTWNTFRDHLILEYEVPKYDGDLGAPNFFIPLPEETCRRKTSLLLEHFGSQRSRHWFTEDLFLALMRLRGMESNSPTRYAEAFFCRKVVL